MSFVFESLRADWEAFLVFLPRLIYAVILLLVTTAVDIRSAPPVEVHGGKS